MKTSRPVKKTVVARSGDCVASIAARNGLDPDELWNDPDNATLRAARKSPFVLCPGDVLRVQARPDAECPVAHGAVNRYRAVIPSVHLRIRLWGPPSGEGQRGAPQAIADAPYTLLVGNRSIAGRTRSDGHVDERIPAVAREAELVVWPGTPHECRTWIRIGALLPDDDARGTCQRLSNLGFGGMRSLEDQTRAFQEQMGLPPSGVLDDATRAKLSELHEG